VNGQQTALNAYLKRTYKMTEADYENQLASQGYVCEICRGLNPLRSDGSRERLACDHNHATGENRALLCQRCNRVLGMLGDSQELAVRVFEYLRRHDGSPIPYQPPNLEEPAYALPVSASVHKVNGEPHRDSSENLPGAETPKQV
jgi:Recombination endonuclease VII